MTQLNPEWINWAIENVARGVPNTTIVKAMVDAGIDDAAANLLVNKVQNLPGYAVVEQAIRKNEQLESALAGLKKLENKDEIMVSTLPHVRLQDKTQVTIEGHTVTVQMELKNPNIVLFNNFLSPQECMKLIELSINKITPSLGIDDDTGEGILHPDRTGSGTYFQRGDNELIQRIEKRIAKLLNWPINRGEGIQILNYKVGEQYKPHFDYFVNKPSGIDHTKTSGQRLGTLLMYLNDPDLGGATTFPNVGLKVYPVMGNALFFRYPDPKDPITLHAGDPVIAGQKWLATKWLRQRKY